MSFREDLYPTRLARPMEPFPRRDPVIHADAAQQADGPLNTEQLAAFERDGFLVLPDFFPRHQMEGFRRDLDSYGQDQALKARPEVITERDSGQLRSLFAVHEWSDRFDRLTREPRLLDAVRQLLGSDVYIHQSRINLKPAFHGRGFEWHSDFETWHAEDGMPRMRCVSASVTLTENSTHNGPLLLVPGSHKWFLPTLGTTPQRYWEHSLKQQTLGVPEPAHLRRLIEAGGIRPCQGGPGTLILFECNTLHASGDNLSPWPRSNLFFVFNSVENSLQAPFAAPEPRPEWIAARKRVPVLEPRAWQQQAIA